MLHGLPVLGLPALAFGGMVPALPVAFLGVLPADAVELLSEVGDTLVLRGRLRGEARDLRTVPGVEQCGQTADLFRLGLQGLSQKCESHLRRFDCH